ncbi:MAG: hypothetical protein EBS19_11785, partial [Spirochaetia bacterium]|nr:hypothetical protein [Spirochaetia bacterium]
MDGDDLDILVITNKNIKNNNYYNAYIIGVLIMEDENGMDEKVLCVLEEDYDKIKNMSDLDEKIIVSSDQELEMIRDLLLANFSTKH